MDPHYYGRYAMAGWILVAVILVSSWELQTSEWVVFVKLIQSANASFALGLLGVIIGIGAPPAVGFVLQRIIYLFLFPFFGNMWIYKCVRKYSCNIEFDNSSNTIKGSAAFHMCFYSFARNELREWARRRRTQMYASFTSLLAIICALSIIYIKYSEFPRVAGWISIACAVFLLIHGIREGYYHKKTIAVWIDSFKDNSKFPCNLLIKE